MIQGDLGGHIDVVLAGRRGLRSVSVSNGRGDLADFLDTVLQATGLGHRSHSEKGNAVVERCKHLLHEHVATAVHQTFVESRFGFQEPSAGIAISRLCEVIHASAKLVYIF